MLSVEHGTYIACTNISWIDVERLRRREYERAQESRAPMLSVEHGTYIACTNISWIDVERLRRREYERAQESKT